MRERTPEKQLQCENPWCDGGGQLFLRKKVWVCWECYNKP